MATNEGRRVNALRPSFVLRLNLSGVSRIGAILPVAAKPSSAREL